MSAESRDPWTLPETFVFEGQAVRFARLGGAERPPLVFLHGTPFSSLVWRRIAPQLIPHRQVFYYDLLGYGRSEMRAGQQVSLEVQGQLFAALLKHWGLATPDVVAHDFGGCTALRAHLLHACDYRSLTLIDPVALAPWGSPFVRHVREHEAAFTGLPAYIHAAILAAYISGAAFRALPESTLKLYVDPWLGGEGQAAFYRQIAQMDQRYTDEIEARYAEMRCPIRIIWGEQDRWIPLERGRELASRIPGSHLQVVPEAGHLVQEDAPQALLTALLTDLALQSDR
jgi:pimeloyl-ACP methyl ester carboxylesterase